MKKTTIVLEKAIQDGDNKTIEECLNSINEKLIEKYGVIFKSKDERENFFSESFHSLLDEYTKEKLESSEKKMYFETFYKRNILNKLRLLVANYSKEDISNITNNYVNSKMGFYNIKNTDDYVKWLEKIDIFYLMMRIEPSTFLIEKILNNKKILEVVSKLIKASSVDGVIDYEKVYEVSQGRITSMILEFYCRQSGIKIEGSSSKDSTFSFSSQKVSNYTGLDSLKMYLNEIRVYPLLSPLEEMMAFNEYYSGNKSVREKIIKSNLRLAVSIAKDYLYTKVEFLDLIQYANLGLYEAFERYSVDSGYKFSTYATWWIKQSITRSVAIECNRVRMPVWLVEAIGKYHGAVKALSMELGREPELVEVAEYLEWKIDKVMTVIESEPKMVFLDKKINSEDEESDSMDNFIPSKISVEDDVVDDVSQKELSRKIFEVLDSLNVSDKEINVILYRFGFKTGKEETLESTAIHYNVSRERIRQIETKVLYKLRTVRAGKELAYYLDNPEAALKNLEDKRDLIAMGKKDFNSSIDSVREKKKTYKRVASKKRVSDGNVDYTFTTTNTSQSNVMSVSDKEKFLASHSNPIVLDKSKNIRMRTIADDNSYDDYGDNENDNLEDNDDTTLDLVDDILGDSLEKDGQVTSYEQKTIPTEDKEKSVVSIETQDSAKDSSLKQVKRRRTYPRNTLSLKEAFSEVPDDVLNKIILTFPIEHQEIIKKREASKLDKREGGIYTSTIVPKVKRRIAREVALGNVNEEVLTIYGIQPNKPVEEVVKDSGNKQNDTLGDVSLEEKCVESIETQDTGGDSSSVKTVKHRSYATRGLSLKEAFSEVPDDVLNRIVLSFPGEYQEIIKKREASGLNTNEASIYNTYIMPKVKRRLAREADLGNVGLELLAKYNIQPNKPVGRPAKSLYRVFDKIDEEILKNIVSTFPAEHQKIIEKRDTGKLDSHESLVYAKTIVPKVKRKIAMEVSLGNVSEEVLTIYNIKPNRPIGRPGSCSSKDSLYDIFDKIDKEILKNIVSTFPIEHKEIIEKGGRGQLDSRESQIYIKTIIPKVKRRIAKEVALGNLDSEVLDIYKIKPVILEEDSKEKSKRAPSIRETFSKVPDDVFDRLLQSLSDLQLSIAKKRENSVLSKEERAIYYGTVIPRIKKGIVREIYLGNLPKDLIDEYKIVLSEQVAKQIEGVRGTGAISGLNLKQTFSKIDGDLLDSWILELPEEQQAVVKKREAGIKLTEKEKSVYFTNVYHNIKAKIASEVARGNISENMLLEYNIDPSILIPRKVYNSSVYEKYSKIDKQVLDTIIDSLPLKYRNIIEKRGKEALTSNERATYYATILRKIEVELAKEGGRGIIPLDILDEYKIKPIESVARDDINNIAVQMGSNKTNNYDEGFFDTKQENVLSLEEKEQLLNSVSREHSSKLLITKVNKKTSGNKTVDTIDKDGYVLSLRKRFFDVDRGVLEGIISEFPKAQRIIIARREVDKFNNSEDNIYSNVIVPRVERRLAEEVLLGNLSPEVLRNHNITPVTKVRKRRNVVKEDKVEEVVEKTESSEYDVLSARLLTLVKDQKTEQLDDMEIIFSKFFDSVYLTSDLNPKMFSYIKMRFGYLDGNNYSRETISRVLSSEDIDACRKNVCLYVKYELSKLDVRNIISEYQKTIDSKKM